MRRWNFYIQFTFGKVRPVVLCFFKGDHQLKSQANVDQMTERLDDVRFTPESGHPSAQLGRSFYMERVMSAGIKVVLAVLAGFAASALTRFSYGPGPAETYTGGFIYWLNYYSGFDFGVIIAGIVWLVMWESPNRASIAANCLLAVTVVAVVVAMFGVFGK